MRAWEVLTEYSSIGRARTSIVKTISGLDTKDEEHVKLIDRIYKILNKKTINATIMKSFSPPLKGEKWSDKRKTEIIKDVAEIVFGLNADVQATHTFLDKLESGGVVNIAELSKPLNTFASIFDGDAVAIECFNQLRSYGVGQQQKGPGEFAFAILSDQITLSTRGDLEIKGLGLVEVKTQKAKDGGALGHGGQSNSAAMAIISPYLDILPSAVIHFQKTASLSLKRLMEIFNRDLPINQAGNKKKRVEITTKLLEPVFGSHASKMGKAMAQENIDEAIKIYVTENWDWYKTREKFKNFLALNFPTQKTMMINSADDIINLRMNGQLKDFKINVIPSGSGPREVFVQINMSAKKG